ncbi:hypothetical protein AVEN_217571-1 [Araneus ventricosus]|uniref:Uncharacterized protein n=1 Tax=Araneus ventricosus TaxID=182803 RepID=A0A4Y2KXN8_ARAVE|nr:hypothetical protein AVEN_217571-1 [Araneus ventricosus]
MSCPPGRFCNELNESANRKRDPSLAVWLSSPYLDGVVAFLFLSSLCEHEILNHRNDMKAATDTTRVSNPARLSMGWTNPFFTFSYTKYIKRKYYNRQKIRTLDFDESPRFTPP